MKNLLFLVIGLFVAGLSAWAVPENIQENPVKIEIPSIQSVDAIVDMEQAAPLHNYQSERLCLEQGGTQMFYHEPLRTKDFPLSQRYWRTIDRVNFKEATKQFMKRADLTYEIRVTQHRL